MLDGTVVRPLHSFAANRKRMPRCKGLHRNCGASPPALSCRSPVIPEQATMLLPFSPLDEAKLHSRANVLPWQPERGSQHPSCSEGPCRPEPTERPSLSSALGHAVLFEFPPLPFE